MQGHAQIIDCLKELLRGELAARDQYFIHSRQYEDQGFVRLYERLNHEMQEETQHADVILRRDSTDEQRRTAGTYLEQAVAMRDDPTSAR